MRLRMWLNCFSILIFIRFQALLLRFVLNLIFVVLLLGPPSAQRHSLVGVLFVYLAFVHILLQIVEPFVCAAPAHVDRYEGVEYLLQRILAVHLCLHNIVHGGVAHLVHDVIVDVAPEESVLYAFLHEEVRVGALSLVAEKLQS